jgi:hypothetical protein
LYLEFIRHGGQRWLTGAAAACAQTNSSLNTCLFACGGLICSMLLVDGSDNFLGPHYWPRKSFSSPALATPQRPVTAPTVPQRGMFKSNGDDKNAVLQEHRVSDRKPSIPPLSFAFAAQNSVGRG